MIFLVIVIPHPDEADRIDEATRLAGRRWLAEQEDLGVIVEHPRAFRATGGFMLAHWCGDSACETAIHEETKATVRVITFDGPAEDGVCVRCNGPSKRRVHFAKAY